MLREILRYAVTLLQYLSGAPWRAGARPQVRTELPGACLHGPWYMGLNMRSQTENPTKSETTPAAGVAGSIRRAPDAPIAWRLRRGLGVPLGGAARRHGGAGGLCE